MDISLNIQAKRVKEIASDRFPKRDNDSNDFVILGDLNDYLESDSYGRSAIRNLVNWDSVVDVMNRIPYQERWTYYSIDEKSRKGDVYRQLDYILISRSLAKKILLQHQI
jgi:predicted extracellular nuclease